MKAIVCTAYGSLDVLQLKEVEKPIPKDGEVLIKIAATSVNAGDWHLLRADPFLVRLAFGLFKPKVTILGADIAGTVEAVGSKVTQWQPGDAVFGDISTSGFGAFAEYVSVPEHVLASKPESLSFEEAAAVPAASVTALQALRDKGQIQPGQKVLVNGASGGVGTFAVQIAKALGAEVTAVCSTQNVERVLALGADHVIDYSKEDFTRNGQAYALILAANGDKSIFDYKRALSPKGRYVMTGGEMKQFYEVMFLAPWISMTGSRKMGNLLVNPNQADLKVMTALIDDGKVKPVIDRRYSLQEVPDAIRYLEEGHAQGKVVVSVEARNDS